MIDIISTGLTIYFVGCPALTALFVAAGMIQVNYNPDSKQPKAEVVKDFILFLYFGWWEWIKAWCKERL